MKIRICIKKQDGLDCAAIYLVFEIQFNNNVKIEELLHVSKKMLERNLASLRKNLENIDIYALAKTIHGTMY